MVIDEVDVEQPNNISTHTHSEDRQVINPGATGEPLEPFTWY